MIFFWIKRSWLVDVSSCLVSNQKNHWCAMSNGFCCISLKFWASNTTDRWQNCPERKGCIDIDVSENRGTPKSSILIGFSIINHPFWGTPMFFSKHPYRYIDPLHFHFQKIINTQVATDSFPLEGLPWYHGITNPKPNESSPRNASRAVRFHCSSHVKGWKPGNPEEI